MTPLRICGFILMAVLTIFFLLLICVGMVRVLRTPLQKDTTTQEQTLAIDILVTDKIPVTEKDIAQNQHVMIAPGMSILISQNTDQDGLYLVDATSTLIRIDCVKSALIYLVDVGKHRGLQYKPSDKRTIQDNIHRQIIENDASIVITENIAQLILFLKKEARTITLDYTDISCLLTVVNTTGANVSLVSAFQKHSISLTGGSHNLIILENEIKRDGCGCGGEKIFQKVN